jgi:hypothetical protein
MVAGVTQDLTGNQLVQLCHEINITRFLLLPLESKMRDTSHLPSTLRTSPVTITDWAGRHIQEQMKDGFWLPLSKKILETEKRK